MTVSMRHLPAALRAELMELRVLMELAAVRRLASLTYGHG